MTATRPGEATDTRWEALERNDDQADGTFVYAVKTTGIYCRPSCASKRPNRANVRFFETPDDARKAGYRACKRCQPDQEATESSTPPEVATACRIIERSDRPPAIGELAVAVGLSGSHLTRLFKAALGMTPRQYALELRARRLRDGLAEGKPVLGAILGAGFGSVGRGYEGAVDALGMTPARYQGGASGETIRFAAASTSMGWLLVASTDRGLCSIELGDSVEALEARLRKRFPGAEVVAGDDQALRQVVAVVEDPGIGLDLPLDIRGTAFQRRVWEALRAIPIGTTATYAEVARSIGQSSAVRAVATACASNVLALVIPCHRVVRTDGGLGGYRWGVERKRALLDLEARHPVSPGPLDE